MRWVSSIGNSALRASARSAALAVAILLGMPAAAQVETERPPVVAGAKPVTIERIKVHSPAIEGNLEGEIGGSRRAGGAAAELSRRPARRYPVVYALHGYSIGAEQWIKEIHDSADVEGAFAKGAQEMIVVLPDSKTVHNGSMYSSSVTTGDFETFVARDLVAYIDCHYRTLPRRESRGLVGHSMGGYGASRIGMKHADVFGALYMMSPCCLSARPAGGALTPEMLASIATLKPGTDMSKVPFPVRGMLAMASAWSPPAKPLLFVDLPYDNEGQPVADVLAAGPPIPPSPCSIIRAEPEALCRDRPGCGR